MKTYVVCTGNVCVRDAQFLDTRALSQEAYDALDPSDPIWESLWHDINPCIFVGIEKANEMMEACQKAGMKNDIDPRCLFCIEVA